MIASGSPLISDSLRVSALQHPLSWPLAPLAPDTTRDEAVETTCRGLARVAHVAIETALRFEREDGGRDALAWMTTPRSAFDGLAPVEACLSLEHCVRATLMHALGVEDGGDAEDEGDLDRLVLGEGGGRDGDDRVDGGEPGGQALHVAVLVEGPVRGLVAAVCGSFCEMEAVVGEAFGTAAGACRIRRGFDARDPHVAPFLSETLGDEVGRAAAAPVAGFRLLVRHGERA